MADDWKSLQEQFRQIQEGRGSGDQSEDTMYYGCQRRIPGDCLGRLLGFGIVATFIVVPIFYGVYSQTTESAACREAIRSELRGPTTMQLDSVGGDSYEEGADPWMDTGAEDTLLGDRRWGCQLDENGELRYPPDRLSVGHR